MILPPFAQIGPKALTGMIATIGYDIRMVAVVDIARLTQIAPPGPDKLSRIGMLKGIKVLAHVIYIYIRLMLIYDLRLRESGLGRAYYSIDTKIIIC